MTNNRKGLLVGSLVVAGTLAVLLVAGGVFAQGGWGRAAAYGGMMGSGMGGMMDGGMMGGGMMGGGMMGGGMGSMDPEDMQAHHAQCEAAMASQEGNSTQPAA